MREPRTPSTTEGYERPQQAWQCGLADDGPPCPLGPDGSGHCPAAAACRPVRNGERWQCNRSTLRGGPCAAGPGPDGMCAVVHQCTPVRSLRTRRGRFFLGVVAATIGAACMALSGDWRNALISPGPLSAQHAQLLEHGGASAQCAHCHAAAELTVGQWWERSTKEARGTPTQPTLCLTCHEQAIDRKFALAAHGAPLENLQAASDGGVEVAWDQRVRDPRQPIACSACHHEHQGLKHNLAAMNNDACQACHQEHYDSFANGHPEFGAWPYERRTRIVFDHASHQAKHFPSQRKEFACTACHKPDAKGMRQLTGDYATTCAECHDKSIAASLADGAPMLALPTIDVEALTAVGPRPEWPEEATGEFEGAQPAAAVLLMTSDPAMLSAAASLGPAFDLYDVNPDDAAQLTTAAVVAASIRNLVDELAGQGQVAIEERLNAILGRKLRKEELTALSAGLSPDVVRGFRNRWFGGGSPQEAATDRAGELHKSAAGGWIRDDATLSLRYQPVGHADPWLRGWFDVLAEAASGPHAAVFEPLLRAAMKPTASGQCGSCHSIERDESQRLAIQWRPFDPAAEPVGFTSFDHGPHVIQPQTGDCQSCHRISSSANATASYAGDDPHRFIAGFEALDKAMCAACHIREAAGDSCTQCHNYHAPPSLRAE